MQTIGGNQQILKRAKNKEMNNWKMAETIQNLKMERETTKKRQTEAILEMKNLGK